MNGAYNVCIYNIPLCLLPDSFHDFAQKSISDWKNDYPDICQECKKERNVLWIVHNINKTIQRIKSDTIMGKIRICSKPPKPIVSLSETYTVLSSYKSGRVTLCLTPDGEYLFTVYGDISESTAKRSSTHKATEQKMTNIMLKMYEDAQDAYNCNTKRRVNYRLASSYSVQQNVKPQDAYQWKTLDIKKPTDNEIKRAC